MGDANYWPHLECLEGGLDHAHKHDVRGDDIKRDDVGTRERPHVRALEHYLCASLYCECVCASEKRGRFCYVFFCVIAFSVNRRGFMASAVFGRIFNNNSVMSSWVQRMHLKYCNVTSNSLRKLW